VKKGRPKKVKGPLWAWLLVIFGAILMLGSGGTVVAFHVALSAATKSFGKQNLLGAAAAGGGATHASITGPKNILMVGVDARPGQSATDPVRSDTIMILHIPANHTEGFLVSIPRDTLVTIPAYNNGKHKTGPQQTKINAAFAIGGTGLTGDAARQHSVELLALTIKSLYGISFDAAAIVDFTGFQEVVNVLGTVHMCVDEDTKSIHIGYTKSGKQVSPSVRLNSDGTVAGPLPGVTPKDYPKGCYNMKPWEALDFVRQRDLLEKKDTDYGRQRHQQQFIKAIFTEILSKGVLTNPGKLTGVLNTVGKAMTIDREQFSIQDWLFAMKGIGASDLITMKTNDGTFFDVPGPDSGSYQGLSPTSLQMLQAVKDDAMDAFVSLHPDWVAASAS
jgi:LCP family protein required for cell wall assembly